MIKLMVASDIHGSAYYCKKMLEAFDREQADRLLLLGDILYHGPRNDLPKEYDPKEVIKMLNERKNRIFCVRGNCDTEVDQMVLEFPIHGHHFNLNTLPPMQPGDILLHGHTHIPAWEPFGDGNLYLNPGSVSIPKEGSEHSYMILKAGEAVWKTLEGEIFHSIKLKNLMAIKKGS